MFSFILNLLNAKMTPQGIKLRSGFQ